MLTNWSLDAIRTATYAFVAVLGFLFFVISRWAYQQNPDPFSPVMVITVAYAVQFLVGALMVLWYPEHDAFGITRFLPLALGFAASGYIFFVLGFVTGTKSTQSTLSKALLGLQKEGVGPVIVFLLLLGWAARALLWGSFGFYFRDERAVLLESQAVGFVLSVENSVYIGLILLSVFVYSSTKRRWRALLILVIIAELVYRLPSGVKAFGFTLPLIPFVARAYLQGLDRRAWAILGVFTFLFLFVLMPVLNVYRLYSPIYGGEATRNLSEVINYVDYALTNTFGQIREMGWNSYLSYTIEYVGFRLTKVDVLAALMDRMPRMADYYYGRSFLVALLSFIPRFVWPERPVAMLGIELPLRLQLNAPWDYWSTTNFSVLEELYINFSYFGMPLMFLYGRFLRWCYNSLLYNSTRSPLSVFVYIWIWMFFLSSLEMPLSNEIQGVLQSLPIVLFVVVAHRRSKSEAWFCSQKTPTKLCR